MKHYAANKIPSILGYKFLSGAVIPRPIAWVVTKNKENGITNAAPFSFFNVVAPNLVSISILGGPYGRKDTARNLLENGEAVIHLVNHKNVEEMNQTSASLSPLESEITQNSLETIQSETVTPPSLKNADIRMEVKLHQHIPVEKDGTLVSELFLLEVVEYYFNEEIFDEEHAYIIPEKFRPLGRLAGSDYVEFGEVFALERPR
ncbi:NADH-FMN oxidoreductase RutF, flavin reductase (DIM6/NTAB) family [Pilibacter termitis]|uniref:NADH-FMN oxidoreductase RutF, flavin reductase (DIM6/NTAB) family n=1 Tax=Pilibacter termitis TaxID=263852 RepID=A0A1T4MS67_9ENTE|nr:flavin reductase family protein [Pilibacter termitis]SJZ69676.1 NADH-FMN oxidoreductase RutF, flavin reductase (DIM6/NTAB) family [Pilibacter termitis]